MQKSLYEQPPNPTPPLPHNDGGTGGVPPSPSSIYTVHIPYTPHPGQQLVHQSPARFRVLNCGRRWGKSLLAIWECFDAAISNTEKLVWYIGPTYKQSKPIWRLANRKYPAQYIKDRHEVEKEIVLITDSIIEFKSADNPNDLRSVGENLILVVFDECAYLKPEIWAIMRPALMDNKAKVLFISTPAGRNWFYELWLRGQKTIDGSPNPHYSPNWESWKFSSFENPYISPEEIDELIRESGMSPQEVAREIYAEFVEVAGHVFSLSAIEACTISNAEHELALAQAKQDAFAGTVIGLDIARVQNFTVAIVMDRFARVLAHKAMQGPWTAQAKTIRHFWEKFNKPTIIFDSTGIGDAFKPLLINEGIYNIRSIDFRKMKSRLIENLKVGIEEHEISFPAIPQLIRELQHFEARETTSGRIDYSAPRGIHDDYVMALALAYWGVSKAEHHTQGPRIKLLG